MKRNIFLIIVLLMFIFHSGKSQEWRIDTVNVFFPANVYTLEVIDDELYVGGDYYSIGDTIYKGIAKWDSINWFHIGGGSNSASFFALKMFENELYAGGSFIDMEGDYNIRGIAAWNGTNWNALGTEEVSGAIRDMEIHDNKLFVCGNFQSIGSVFYNCIAAWDGANWNVVGSFPIILTAIEEYNGELYAGGYHHSLRKYTGGTSWVDVAGKNDNINDMLVDTFNNFLYVAGYFSMFNSIECDGLAMFDGYEWHGISDGSPYDAALRVIEIYQGDIYCGGYHIMIDGKENFVTRWTGTKWDTLGSGVNSTVETLEVYKDELYVGGYFDTVNGQPCPGLARWYVPPDPNNCRYMKPRVFAVADTFYLSQGSVDAQFYNNNAYVDTWTWDFDDTGTDNVQNPVHTYNDTGTFDVEVIVTHNACTDTASKTITVLNGTGINEIDNLKFKIYPNPSDGNFYIEMDHQTLQGFETLVRFNPTIKITNLNGQTITEIPITGNKTIIDTEGWSKGTYICNLFVDGKLLKAEKMILK